jgi:hypothetical protein
VLCSVCVVMGPKKGSSGGGATTASSSPPYLPDAQLRPIHKELDARSASRGTATAAPDTPTRRRNAQASLYVCVLVLCVSHWKAASKLLSAALSKYGPQAVLRVLQAVGHAAQGERTEARAIIQALPPLEQLEPRAFNMLVHCYRIMDDGQSQGPLPPLSPSPARQFLFCFFSPCRH